MHVSRDHIVHDKGEAVVTCCEAQSSEASSCMSLSAMGLFNLNVIQAQTGQHLSGRNGPMHEAQAAQRVAVQYELRGCCMIQQANNQSQVRRLLSGDARQLWMKV